MTVYLNSEGNRSGAEGYAPVVPEMSHQLCFAAGDCRAYVRDRAGAALTPGVIRDVGEDSDLWAREVEVEALNLIAVDPLSAPVRVREKIRYAHEPQPATATPLSAAPLRLAFDEPQRQAKRRLSIASTTPTSCWAAERSAVHRRAG